MLSKIFWTFAVKLLGSISTLVLTIVIARKLGDATSGVVLLGFTYVMFFSTISRCGLDVTILKFVSAKNDKEQGAYQILLLSMVLVSIAAIVISSLFFLYLRSSQFFGHDNIPQYDFLIHIIPAIIFFSITSILSVNLQANGFLYASVFYFNIFNNLLLISFFLTLTKVDLVEIAHVFLLSSFITCLCTAIYTLWIRAHKSTYISTLTVLKTTFPLWIVAIMQQLVLWAGQLIAPYYVQSKDIAMLSASLRLSVLISFVLVTVNFVLAPRYARLHILGDIIGMQLLAAKTTYCLLFFSIIPFLIIYTFPEKIVVLLFGLDFESAASLLVVLSFGQFINVLTGSVGNLLSMSGNGKLLMQSYIAAAAVSVALTVYLIPKIGIMGAAYSTAIAMIVQNMTAVYYVRKYLRINVFLWPFALRH